MCTDLQSMSFLQGELLTIYAALPYIAKSGFLEYPLPNVLNFSFSYHTYLLVVMVSYIPSKF